MRPAYCLKSSQNRVQYCVSQYVFFFYVNIFVVPCYASIDIKTVGVLFFSLHKLNEQVKKCMALKQKLHN